MGVRVLENQKDFEMVLKEAGCRLVIIDFSATWCGPCKVIKPRFHELAEKNPTAIFCDVDVDDAADIAEHCGISCMPTFQFYKNGTKVFEFSGANRMTLEDKIQELQTFLYISFSDGYAATIGVGFKLNVDQEKDFEMVLKDAGCRLVIIDFSATWCGPCEVIKPHFHELAEKNPTAIFCDVDVDDAADIAEHCGISCMPTFQFYKNGTKVFEFSGANRMTLEDKIQELQ